MVETSAGKGSLIDSEWLIGGVGVNGNPQANEFARRVDLVICVGTRLSDFTTGSSSLFQHHRVEFVGVNTNAADAYKMSATPIVADAREALEQLGDYLDGSYLTTVSYRAVVKQAREDWSMRLEEHVHANAAGERLAQASVLRALNEHVRGGEATGWWRAAAATSPATF